MIVERARVSTSPPRTRWSLTLAVVLAMAVVVSCSKQDEPEITGPAGPTPVLTKADFIHQADAICTTAEQRISALTDAGGAVSNGDAGSKVDMAALVRDITPLATTAIGYLKNLTPPPEIATAWADGLTKMNDALAAAQKDPTGRIDPIGLVDEQLNSYGLTTCFTSPTS
jgi:hypothetical protein